MPVPVYLTYLAITTAIAMVTVLLTLVTCLLSEIILPCFYFMQDPIKITFRNVLILMFVNRVFKWPIRLGHDFYLLFALAKPGWVNREKN